MTLPVYRESTSGCQRVGKPHCCGPVGHTGLGWSSKSGPVGILVVGGAVGHTAMVRGDGDGCHGPVGHTGGGIVIGAVGHTATGQ